ncbi:exo-alpha-sialidase [Iamia sp. SCSIO 61187]|uniref:F510_1955 family glycosylhydrolase n=1 Tax=Iamia sp. SCSIO 61187 TaxID=2722752 RepID=UPI001C638FBE|nr:hypothetical protein [Iamia sp. SCSIO 61187]QYG94253.1 exo-alpha-sialidase [Iamia sp. SCSIO 61187]
MPVSATTARRRTPPPSAWLVVPLNVAVLVGAVPVIVGRDRDADCPSTTSTEDDLGVAHVHGLGIDPADDSLYIATHHGMFRIEDGAPPQTVGETVQDTMGFTVTGPGRFLGSGHPDVAGLEAGDPGLLGLIESTDAGESWDDISLSGEADFHALVAVHDLVYGWDSTSSQLMVAPDGRDWEVWSRIALTGFAVDPADEERTVAATPEGVRLSSDGGRRWDAPSSPVLVVVSWAADGPLWGLEPSGRVQRSDDGGSSWEPAGALDEAPQALLATGDDLWAAASDEDDLTGIYRSDDGGETWNLEHRDEA